MNTYLSIIIPTYHEAANILELVSRIHDVAANYANQYEIIIVDDNSGDGIVGLVHKMSTEGIPIRIIVRTNEKSLSSAVLAGFSQANGDILVCMDSDLSHPPEKIPELISKITQDRCEIAIGSRYIEGASTDEHWSLYRALTSKMATFLARPLTKITDPMSGFFSIRRDVYEKTQDLDPIGFKICLELLVKSECPNVSEVPIHFSDRADGKSKMNLWEQICYLLHLRRLYWFKLQH